MEIDKPTTINKFRHPIPPQSLHKYFKALGFSPLHKPNGDIRESAKQFYKFCQRFISELQPDVVRCFKNPAGGFSNPEVVSQQVVNFMRWRGRKFFTSERRRNQAPVYDENATSKRFAKFILQIIDIDAIIACSLPLRRFEKSYITSRLSSTR